MVMRLWRATMIATSGADVFNISLRQSFHEESAQPGWVHVRWHVSIHPAVCYDVCMYGCVSTAVCNVWSLNPSGLRGAPGYSLEQAHHLPIEMDPLIGQCTQILTSDNTGHVSMNVWDNESSQATAETEVIPHDTAGDFSACMTAGCKIGRCLTWLWDQERFTE